MICPLLLPLWIRDVYFDRKIRLQFAPMNLQSGLCGGLNKLSELENIF
jgi:hypothetical protein